MRPDGVTKVSGLSLAIVQHIMALHGDGWWCEIQSRAAGGVAFQVRGARSRPRLYRETKLAGFFREKSRTPNNVSQRDANRFTEADRIRELRFNITTAYRMRMLGSVIVTSKLRRCIASA